jgi:hypothetical protein
MTRRYAKTGYDEQDGDDMSISTQDCVRCHRPVPDQVSDEFLSWEALDETREQLICPRCLTADQERAIAGDGDATDKATTAIAQSDDADVRDKVAAELCGRVTALISDMVTGLVSDVVTDLEELGGMSASRVEAIARGEEPTNGELEELGYVFVELMRAFKK